MYIRHDMQRGAQKGETSIRKDLQHTKKERSELTPKLSVYQPGQIPNFQDSEVLGNDVDRSKRNITVVEVEVYETILRW
jgi:hypothetical protein